ncbi:AAEL006665-PA [Aedes aegypti]|uniref:AAEL006665-PA n=2 Tax=Aedes aegypti TaxID=7159 RepID=Q175E9_AEDAE|nr:AAEL006665-PA [Aedes aegypti]
MNHSQQISQTVKMARSHTNVSAIATAVSSAKTLKKTSVSRGNGRTLKNPPVNEMVKSALKALKNRKGSSLYAIKRYIGANYECNVAKLSPFIRKALKAGIEKGTLIRTTGIGASGSFKLVSAQAMTEMQPTTATGEQRKVSGLKSSKEQKLGTEYRNGVSKQTGTVPLRIAAKRSRTAGATTSVNVPVKD